jgi:predicted nucleotidyltransferase component of viral defense system
MIMRKEIKNRSASIKARLMNIARAEKIDFDSLLLRYFQERLLYRLSISDFSDRFVLKGGLHSFVNRVLRMKILSSGE